jgi:hypothetical protein
MLGLEPQTASPYLITIPTELLTFLTTFNTKARTYRAWDSEILNPLPLFKITQLSVCHLFCHPQSLILTTSGVAGNRRFTQVDYDPSVHLIATVLLSYGGMGEINIVFITWRPK